MTVIAWDGKTLAVDRMATSGDLATRQTKAFKLDSGEILAFCGSIEQGFGLKSWYENGADVEKWPKFQEDDFTCLVLAKNKEVFTYCKQPYPVKVEDKYSAWGSGSEFAIGAMAMGANAKQAVKVASKHCVSCGNGVDTFKVKP